MIIIKSATADLDGVRLPYAGRRESIATVN
jgi:hypothetical protein